MKILIISNSKGALIYTTLIIMVIVLVLAILISEIVMMLKYQRRERIREEEILLLLDNTVQEAIDYVKSTPYEEVRHTKGIYSDLMQVKYPEDYVMLNEKCGFIASLLSLSGNNAIWEIWARCSYIDVDKIEKVKVKFSMLQL